MFGERRFSFADRHHRALVNRSTMSKKSAKSAKETASYETRDIVLGKVRGYPPWPGMVGSRVCSLAYLNPYFFSSLFICLLQVVDPDSVPPLVLKERPTTKKTHFYCVRFFPTGD